MTLLQSVRWNYLLNFNDATVDIWEWLSDFIPLGIWLPTMLRLKLNRVSKSPPPFPNKNPVLASCTDALTEK